MDAILLGVDPRPPTARVLAMAGPAQTLLKARLLPEASISQFQAKAAHWFPG
jgi:hypothetical protein